MEFRLKSFIAPIRISLALLASVVLAGCAADSLTNTSSSLSNRGLAFANAIKAAENGTINIILDTQPDSPVEVVFNTNEDKLKTFELEDDGDETNKPASSRTFEKLKPGTYRAQINVPAGWELVAINCYSNPNGGEGTDNNVKNLLEGWVDINVEASEIATCTFVIAQIV